MWINYENSRCSLFLQIYGLDNIWAFSFPNLFGLVGWINCLHFSFIWIHWVWNLPILFQVKIMNIICNSYMIACPFFEVWRRTFFFNFFFDCFLFFFLLSFLPYFLIRLFFHFFFRKIPKIWLWNRLFFSHFLILIWFNICWNLSILWVNKRKPWKRNAIISLKIKLAVVESIHLKLLELLQLKCLIWFHNCHIGKVHKLHLHLDVLCLCKL